MSIFDKLLGSIGIVTRSSLKAEIRKLERWHLDTADAQQWYLPDPYIYANQADLYRLDPNLGGVLDMFAEDIGLETFNVKRRRGEDMVDIPNHEFELLLESPNPLDTGMELIAQTVTDYKLNGNAVWWLSRKSFYDKPKEIWYIPFSQIQPQPDGRSYLSHYNYFPGNGKEAIPLPVWQIVHFKTRNPFHRFIGLSPIESLVDTLMADIGMRKTQRQTYVQNMGEPPSILAFKDYIQDDAWADVKNAVEQSARDNKMLKLRGAGDGVTWMSRAMSNKEMDLVALYQQTRSDIWDRLVPGARVMLDGNANRSTADAARATYTESLWRMMQVLAKKITKEILYVYTWGEKLAGVFNDPRFVDRQLKLAEIQEYGKWHTIEEVRKEHYQDDPLDDERDKLFEKQINSTVGDGTEKPVPPQLQAFTGQEQDETMDNPEEEQQAGEQDESVKATIDALYKWRKQVKSGRMEKALQFTNRDIPVRLANSIKARLKSMDSAQALKMMDAQIERLKPQPQPSGADVLKGIELSVRAMEARK